MMTPHPEPLKVEVGVRELQDRLSRYVQHVQGGGEVVVTMRGRRVDRTSQPSRTTSAAQVRRARVRPRRGPTALIVYFDTPALIKLIFDEPGSELAVELWDRADLLVSSQLVYVSAVAALEDLYAQLRIVAIDEPLARRAGDVAAQHALHIACALDLKGALNSAARATGRLLANDTG